MALQRDDLKAVRQTRHYLAKDFDSLRAQLLEHARLYYPNRIKDFSEASLGGLFLDLAAFVGDNLSFYLDHQYGELNYETAVEPTNIEKAIRAAGVSIIGASPALVPVTIFIKVPAEKTQNVIGPSLSCFPIVQAGSIFPADNGVEFILLEDVDFSKKRSDGTYFAEIKIAQKTNTGVPTSYILALSGLCISGKEITESFSIGKQFVPFRRITLSNANVSEILSVIDGYGNTYYNVAALTHDIVYRNVLNTAKDSELVKDALKIIPAPFRFTSETDIATRKTTLIFGGGNANSLEDDIIPDPSDFAISFPYSKTFSRIPINPSQLLQTKTLGVAATDTTLQVTYRYGGGLNHVVNENNIRSIKTLKMFFPGNPSQNIAANIRGSVEVTNTIRSSGGEDAPSIDDLKALIPSAKNSQERTVSREDLIARVYSLPTNFGRVFRVATRSNPNNPLATQLFVISRDASKKLITSPDTLKKNLKTYLNPYRMISDAIDVLDARVINLTLVFSILIDPSLTKTVVLQNVLTKLQSIFDVKNYHIDQPIILGDIETVIKSISGVISINNMKFTNITGISSNRTYSNETFDVVGNTIKGILFPPPGGIFEVRYPEYDITGLASS